MCSRSLQQEAQLTAHSSQLSSGSDGSGLWALGYLGRYGLCFSPVGFWSWRQRAGFELDESQLGETCGQGLGSRFRNQGSGEKYRQDGTLTSPRDGLAKVYRDERKKKV